MIDAFKLKEILGIVLILLPFIALFIYIWIEDGIKVALLTFGTIALTLIVTMLGVWLLTEY